MMFHICTRLQLMLSLILVLNSCLPQRKSSVASEGAVSTLNIQGNAANEGGAPIAGADIYIDVLKDPVARTGGNGEFSVKLDAQQLNALQSSLASGRSTWNIYIKQPGTITLVGASKAISAQQRGSFEAGAIVMQPATTLQGKVLFAAGNLVNPGQGALIIIGREQATAGTDGSFTLKDLPSGTMNVYAEALKYQPTTESITITAGTNIHREEPFVLFQGTEPGAVLVTQPYLPSSSKAAPTTRTFKVKASPAAKYIRYYHTLDELQKQVAYGTLGSPETLPNAGTTVRVVVNGNNGNNNNNGEPIDTSMPGITQWKEIPENINYVFPSEGPAVLWYQVTDATFTLKSDLLQVATVINSCEGVSMALGDGSGIVRTRNTFVAFNQLPSNATRVRVAEDYTFLNNRPWLALAPKIDFAFAIPSSSNTNGTAENSSSYSTRIVYAQIGTTAGECPIITAVAGLQPFPENDGMFVINGGATITESRIVQINIPNLPPNAFEMRLTETTPTNTSSSGTGTTSNTSNNNNNNGNNGSSTTNTTGWMRATPSTAFMFQGTGTRILSLQYRDADGLMSSSYLNSIDVIPSQLASFAITFAQMGQVPVIPPPPSRHLILQLMPPQNAIAFRYLEVALDGGNSNLGNTNNLGVLNGVATDPSAIVSQPWYNLVPFVPVYARGIGLRTYVVQYLTIDGITSAITQSILIEPVPETIGDFVINGGATMSLYPTVELSILPPVNAIAMSATNLTLQQTTTNSSTVFTFGSTISSTSNTNNDQWLAISPTTSFKLDSRGTQTIQMRFRDSNGNVSTPGIARSILYDPFPPFPVGFVPLTINGGSTTTSNPLVTLNIAAQESAHAFRVSLDPMFEGAANGFQDIPTVALTTISGVPWRVFQFNVPFIITGNAGPKMIYVEFKNELGDRSASFSSLINYTP